MRRVQRPARANDLQDPSRLARSPQMVPSRRGEGGDDDSDRERIAPPGAGPDARHARQPDRETLTQSCDRLPDPWTSGTVRVPPRSWIPNPPVPRIHDVPAAHAPPESARDLRLRIQTTAPSSWRLGRGRPPPATGGPLPRGGKDRVEVRKQDGPLLRDSGAPTPPPASSARPGRRPPAQQPRSQRKVIPPPAKDV